MAKKPPQILVDSGAYTAWKLGKPVDPGAYARWLQGNSDWITDAIALDYIDPIDVEEAAQRSFDSWRAMDADGIKTIPVWHRGESIKWLEAMLEQGADYIALSGTAGDRQRDIYTWYDAAFDLLTDSSGNPIVKVHCLADTRLATLVRYPWHSADSADWLLRALRTGRMRLESGVQLSMRNDNQSSPTARGLHTLDPRERLEFESAVLRLGIKPEVFDEQSRACTQMRLLVEAFFNRRSYGEASAARPVWHKRRGGFFDRRQGSGVGKRNDFITLYMVANGNWRAYPCLSHVGLYDTLQSFAYINKPAHADFMRQWASDPDTTAREHPWCKPYAELTKEHLTGVTI